MGRTAKPWLWKARDAYYVTVQGKRIRLVEGKAGIKEAYRRFLTLNPEETKSITARVTGKEVCELFVVFARTNLKPKTHEGYKRFLLPFAAHVGNIDGNEVQPKHVTRFLEQCPAWGKTTRYNAITAIKRAWNWADNEGHLTLNLLAKMKKPRPARREEIPDDREIARFLATAKPDFRLFLDFLYATGCRPGEATIIERRHVDLANREVRFRIGEDKTSGKTGKPRVIHLSEDATAILAKLLAAGPSGALFRNSRGNPWNEHSIACAVRKIRERAGLDGRTVAYALRHHWITDALARGVPLATVAEMSGNSPAIVAKVYAHLSDKKALLMQAADMVRPKT
jgi:integrase